MCYSASFILARESDFFSERSDSHEIIIAEHNLHESGARGSNIVRLEIIPPKDSQEIPNFKAPFDEWTFKVDQDILPDWWNPAEGESRARKLLPKWALTHFIREGTLDLSEMRWPNLIFFGESKAMGMANGRCYFFDNSSSRAQNGGSARFFDNSSSQEQEGGNARFHDASSCRKQKGGNAYFTGNTSSQEHKGGNARFYDNSTSSGQKGGDAYFYGNSTSSSSGRKGGIAHFFNNSSSLDQEDITAEKRI